jgi:hypothetical protein
MPIATINGPGDVLGIWFEQSAVGPRPRPRLCTFPKRRTNRSLPTTRAVAINERGTIAGIGTMDPMPDSGDVFPWRVLVWGPG